MHDANGYGNNSNHVLLAGRLPPHNLEAEIGALGSVLLDADVIRLLLPILKPGDFYRDSHQQLYRAYSEMVAKDIPIDAITFRDYLARTNRLDKIGGFEFVTQIMEATPHAANAKYYAQIVRQNAVKRELIHAANLILTDGYSDQFTAEEMLDAWSKRGEVIAGRELADSGDDDDILAATAADVRRVVSESRWLWPSWIIDGHMTCLAAEPGTGKTRFALDICKRIYHCLPWPDGEMATRPMGSTSLWVASDRQHGEIIHAMGSYGLPDESLYFNAFPSDPCGELKLDDPSEVRNLRRRVKKYRPSILIIDTINKATKRALYRPEESEAFFGPLLDIARDLQVPLFALTHLSRSGDAMDRRIHGTARVMIKMENPGADPLSVRRRLQVTEIRETIAPPPLGITMGSDGNEYDNEPPEHEDAARHSPAAKADHVPRALRSAMEWIEAQLTGAGGKPEPMLCGPFMDAARSAGHGKTTMHAALRKLGVMTEGPKGSRFYRLRLPHEPRPADDAGDDGGEE